MSVEKINDDGFEAVVIKADKPVLVDFFTTQCGPCRALAPILDEIADSRNDVKFVKVDCESASKTADTYDIQCVPTLILFKDGKEVVRREGSASKANLVKWIDAAL